MKKGRYPSLLSPLLAGSFCQGLGRGMRRGLNGAGDGLFIQKIKQSKQTKTTP